MSPILAGTSYGEKTADLNKVLTFLDALAIVRPGGALDTRSAVRMVADHVAALRSDGFEVGDIRFARIYHAGWESLRQRWHSGMEWRNLVARVGERLALAHDVEARQLLPAPPIWPSPAINVFGLTVIATERAWTLCEQSCPTVEDAQVCWEMLCFAEGLLDDLLIATFFQDEARDHIIRPLLALLRVGVVPIGWSADSFECFRFGDGATAVQEPERIALPQP